MQLQEHTPPVHGRIGIYLVDQDGLWIPKSKTRNQIQYGWAHIVSQLCRGNRQFRPSALYLEFENAVAGTITPPSFTRDEGIEYYSDLQYSGTKDFLRVPLLQDPAISIADGYEDYFTDGVSGNVMTFYGMSSGGSGVLGKAFSAGTSTVYGAALVATPVFADRTQDVVFSRGYFDIASQVTQEASHQIGVTWEIALS